MSSFLTFQSYHTFASLSKQVNGPGAVGDHGPPKSLSSPAGTADQIRGVAESGRGQVKAVKPLTMRRHPNHNTNMTAHNSPSPPKSCPTVIRPAGLIESQPLKSIIRPGVSSAFTVISPIKATLLQPVSGPFDTLGSFSEPAFRLITTHSRFSAPGQVARRAFQRHIDRKHAGIVQ